MTPTNELNPFPKTEAPTMGAASTTGVRTEDMVNRAVEGAHRAVDRVAEKAVPAVERLRTGVNDASSALQARKDQLDEASERWVAESRNYVREHPLATVGLAVAAGLLLGRMLRR